MVLKRIYLYGYSKSSTCDAHLRVDVRFSYSLKHKFKMRIQTGGWLDYMASNLKSLDVHYAPQLSSDPKQRRIIVRHR